MKYKKYRNISTTIYLLMLSIIFITFYNVEKICLYLNSDSIISELSIFIFLIIVMCLSTQLVDLILKKYGIEEEKYTEYKFHNLKNALIEYYLLKNQFLINKTSDFVSMYEKKDGAVLLRFIIVDVTKVKNIDKYFTEMEEIYSELIKEIKHQNNKGYIENYIMITENESIKKIENSLHCYTYGKPLYIKRTELSNIGSLILPLVVNEKDNYLYFGKYFCSPTFIESKKTKVIGIIDSI